MRPIHTLTSLSPDPAQANTQRACIESWQAAGCTVTAFQETGELRALSVSSWPGVTWVEVPVKRTSAHVFGRPYIPVSRLVEWAGLHLPGADPVLIVNADIRLDATARMLQDLAATADGGLCYMSRHDVDARGTRTLVHWGIDAFMFAARLASTIPESDILSLGKPAWDYCVPWAFQRAGRPLYSPSWPIALHRIHPQRWGGPDHGTCGGELARLAGLSGQTIEVLREGVRHATCFVTANPAAWERT